MVIESSQRIHSAMVGIVILAPRKSVDKGRLHSVSFAKSQKVETRGRFSVTALGAS